MHQPSHRLPLIRKSLAHPNSIGSSGLEEADGEEAGGWLHDGVPPLVGRHHCSSPFLLFFQSIINGQRDILVFYGSESPWLKGSCRYEALQPLSAAKEQSSVAQSRCSASVRMEFHQRVCRWREPVMSRSTAGRGEVEGVCITLILAAQTQSKLADSVYLMSTIKPMLVTYTLMQMQKKRI